MNKTISGWVKNIIIYADTFKICNTFWTIKGVVFVYNCDCRIARFFVCTIILSFSSTKLIARPKVSTASCQTVRLIGLFGGNLTREINVRFSLCAGRGLAIPASLKKFYEICTSKIQKPDRRETVGCADL